MDSSPPLIRTHTFPACPDHTPCHCGPPAAAHAVIAGRAHAAPRSPNALPSPTGPTLTIPFKPPRSNSAPIASYTSFAYRGICARARSETEGKQLVLLQTCIFGSSTSLSVDGHGLQGQRSPPVGLSQVPTAA
eukprot:7391422-Prymnesium_polylepis.4